MNNTQELKTIADYYNVIVRTRDEEGIEDYYDCLDRHDIVNVKDQFFRTRDEAEAYAEEIVQFHTDCDTQTTIQTVEQSYGHLFEDKEMA